MQVPLSGIKFDDKERFREDLDPSTVAELAESFKTIGQLNPIIIDRNNKLVAGRRRIEAAKQLGWETIRADYWEDLDPLSQKIVEYDENSKRKDLTWQENAHAIAEIHRLKVEKEGKNWTATDTARTLGISLGKVSEDLTLASALDNQKVAARPSRRGALDTLKRERELVLVRELARRRATGIGILHANISTTFTGGIIYRADCREVLREIADNSIDLIIIDPPWGIDFDKAAQWSKSWISSYDDSPNEVNTMLTEVFPELYRVLRPSCHLYAFFPIQAAEWWVKLMTQSGFGVRQRPLIWFKTGQPSISDVYMSFLPAYESILWAYKPGQGDVRRLFARPVPEAQGWPRQPGLWHENEKPVEMLDRWIESSSEINEVVLDVFCGGGSTLASAFALGRYFIGVEVDDSNYARACERIKILEERKEQQRDEAE